MVKMFLRFLELGEYAALCESSNGIRIKFP
jgi:hypothetical protein